MTGRANGNGHAGEFERLVVVRVEDTIEPALTQQAGARYQSPPQTQEQAMTLGGVCPDDIVLADVKGRRFYAIVLARRERELEVEPIDRRVTYRRVKAREVLGIWRKSRARAVRNVETIKRAA